MSELSSQARDLLAEARAGLEPDAARLARGRERMLAATTAAAASAVVGTAAVTGVPAVGAPAIASTAAPIAPATQAAGLGAPALVSVGVAVLAVVAEQGSIAVDCDFCNEKYVFDEADVNALFGMDVVSAIREENTHQVQ